MELIMDDCNVPIGTEFEERGMVFVFAGLKNNQLLFHVVGRELAMPIETAYSSGENICCHYRLIELAVKMFAENFLGEEEPQDK